MGDDGVYLIDPATGTGNFVINLLRRAFERNPRNFEQFYKERLFANEVMLMPYYIASLNIEHEFYELTGKTEPFEGICFVDTLDLAEKKNQPTLTGFFSEENTKRVERQKEAPINVIIGNPPYNMGQLNENDNNKNRAYQVIDNRVKETYAKDSASTLTSAVYDVYVKFFRWAIDRLGDRDGIVCFVTNNSFIDLKPFDGMRKHLMQDFNRFYHLDLHGNVRQNPKLSGTTHNVFGIQVGVGITVAVRSKKYKDNKLFYYRVPEFWRKEQKLAHLTWNVKEDGTHNALNTVEWEKITPSNKYVWIQSPYETEYYENFPIGNKSTRSAKIENTHAVFNSYSFGPMTGRDSTVYDFDQNNIVTRIQEFQELYNTELIRLQSGTPTKQIEKTLNLDVKWSRNLKRHLFGQDRAAFDEQKIRTILFRPFTKKHLYYDDIYVDELGRFENYFPNHDIEEENAVICCVSHSEIDFVVHISRNVTDVKIGGRLTQCFPFYTYDEDGSNRRENITDWALEQFRAQYGDDSIGKWDIFYYVYGLLHHPDYRERYADNLKRELPRIPFVPVADNAGVVPYVST